jgi:hypothetical protein
MRKTRHVESNMAVGDGHGLPADLIARLRPYKWNRGYPVEK